MKRIKIVSVLIALLLAAIISGCIVQEEGTPDGKTVKKVHLIFSYHPEYPWVIEETRGVEDILRGKEVETEKFYLDTKRKTSPEWKKKVSENAVKKIAEFKPDLVIVFDDNACELVAMEYAGKSLPFVFCGMNSDPEDYGFPAENIAGVVERQHINGTIDLLKQLVPNVKKAAIITDNSPTSHGFVTRIEKTALPVEISECYATDDFDAWKAKVKELQSEVDAIGLFVYHTIKDPEKDREVSLPPEDVLNWTLKNNNLPEFAFFDFTVREGALCGVTLSGYEQGKAAAEIAIEILDGKKPADIPIQCPEKGNPIVNERRADELNITVPTDLIKGIEIINGEDREKKEKEEPKEVRFGCALSLSGELEEEGCLTKEGYELWKEHVNSQGGILIGNDRYLIDILYYDDESNPQKTASLVEKLITEDKVDFLLGPYGSSATFEAAALAEKYRVPMVEGEGPAEKIFTQGFKYTFGLLSSSRDYFQNILEGAASLEPKPNRVAILSTDVPYLYIAEGAEQHAKRLGFEVIPIITVEKGDDLSSILSDLKEHEPDMVLFSAPFGEALSFVKIAKEVGLSPKMFGIIVAPCDPAFVEQLGKDADYIFGPCQWTSDLPYDGPVFGSSEDYARLFRDKFGKEPEYHSAAATACGVTYQLALEKASSLDREDVRDALVSLDAMTFYGRIKFNEQGRDIYNPMVAIQVQRGKRVTVWPEHLATGSAKYPTPPWEEREDELKVAVLHIGPIDDYGWTYKAHLGAQAMAEALPYVELSEKEEVCGLDAPQIMREYADTGYKVIFCHAWDFGEYIEQVAPNYPDVIFMWGNGVEKKAPNAGIYYGRMYEAKFLVGMVAGAMTKTNKIGYAAGIPIPDVVRGINAFARGVASVNPDAKVYVEWVGEWYDPPKEREVALALIDNGCDVITHHTDSYAPAVVADERGVYYISLNSNLRMFAPHVFLTGAVWNWTPIMTDVVKAVREGTWDEYPGQDWWYGLAEGGVKLAPFSDLVPEDVREMVEEKKQAIIEGEFEVFPGMTDEELREIYYFESNVVGELP